MKHAFGRDKQYWAERHNSAKSDEEILLCLAMIEIFDLQDDLQQAKQALSDRTKELEMIKRVANDAVSALSELTQQLNLVGDGNAQKA